MLSSLRLTEWFHLVENEIKQISSPHPLENKPDKSFFKDQLIEDLKIDKEKVVDISQKKNLFRVYYKDVYYNIFVEHSDGGGQDKLNVPSKHNKKIGIPSTKAFRKIIDNYERVLVINVYYPLKEDLTIDKENRVYQVIKPEEIYNSEVVQTGNPSSRWVSLKDIQEVIQNKNYILNRKKNVYLIHWENLIEFFDTILTSQYITMIKQKHQEIIIGELEKEEEELDERIVSRERRLFRELLIASGRGIKCEMLNCRINLDRVLIASHIKPVNVIKRDRKLVDEEKLKQISDCNNGFLFCRNHDALFDKFLITFSEEGKIIASNDVEKVIDTFNLNLENVALEIKNQATISYLQFHQEEFRERNRL